MNTNKILIITSEFPPHPGGIGTHAYQTALGLTKNGYEITVLTDFNSEFEDLDKNFDRSLPFHVIRISRTSILITYFARIVKAICYVKQNKEITILCSGKFSLWIGAILTLYFGSLNQLAVVHGTEIKAGGALSQYFTKISLLQFTKIIAVSHYTKSKILEVLPNAIINVIPNGVVIPNNCLDYEPKKVGLKLITVGNLSKRKGQHNLVAALPYLKRYFPIIHYNLVGLPTDALNLQNLASKIGVATNITIHGVLSENEKQNLIMQSHIFLMLSEYLPNGDFEGFGIAVLEANALGIPAIGTRDSGIADAIQDGITGILVNPHNPDEIKSAINTILNNYSTFSSNARNWAISNQWPKVISQYIQVINL